MVFPIVTKMEIQMAVELDATLNLNDFYDTARTDIALLIGGAEVKAAAIFNSSGQDVTFSVYNYTDVVNWVPAQRALVANDFSGIVAASGVLFKIHPNNDKGAEFIVAPGKAYVFHGPGKIEEVTDW